jgi:hypothetical protein
MAAGFSQSMKLHSPFNYGNKLVWNEAEVDLTDRSSSSGDFPLAEQQRVLTMQAASMIEHYDQDPNGEILQPGDLVGT